MYANTIVEYVNAEACLTAGDCSYVARRGHVRRFTRGGANDILGVPLAAALAVSNGRVAIVPADVAQRSTPEVSAAMNGPVEIRNARTGSLLSSFRPAGLVTAVALAGETVGVVSADGSTAKRIERYDARSGAFLGNTIVPPQTEDALDMAGRTLVYRVGNAIFRLDAVTGLTASVAETLHEPIGLTIEGDGLRGRRTFQPRTVREEKSAR